MSAAMVERVLMKQQFRLVEPKSAEELKAIAESQEAKRLADEAEALNREIEYKRLCAAREVWSEYDRLEDANLPCPKELLEKCLKTPRPPQEIRTETAARKWFLSKLRDQRFLKKYKIEKDPELETFVSGREVFLYHRYHVVRKALS
jgi:hypothetical protein